MHLVVTIVAQCLEVDIRDVEAGVAGGTEFEGCGEFAFWLGLLGDWKGILEGGFVFVCEG